MRQVRAALRAAGIEFEEVRVQVLKRDRAEVEELTGQRGVPVLVHGEEVVHDSHRIVEYVEWVNGGAAAERPPNRAERPRRIRPCARRDGVAGRARGVAALGPADAGAAGALPADGPRVRAAWT